jgi:quinol monooxygenase YgiN
MMYYVLIIHEVADYAVWKRIFDDAASIRKEAGEVSYQLLSFEEDNNKVVHFSNWSSLENAKLFFESPKLVQIRKEAGVNAPVFIYLDHIEYGKL